MCRRVFPDDFIENPSLLRPVESALDAGYEDGQQWFYEGRNGASNNRLFVCSVHESSFWSNA